jgi:polysaccharide biosynthesis transport protein
MFKSEDIDLKHYWFIVRRQKRMILSAVCVCVLLATILNLVTPPTYRSTTRIEVSKEPTRSALTGEAIASEDWRSDNVAIYTTAELITSRSLLREVVASLSAHGIMKSGATHAMVARRVGDWVSSAGGSRPAQAESGAEIPAGDDLDREIDWLLTIISVKPIRETRLVSIEVEHRDPKVAREIADTVAQKFVEYQKRTRSRQGNERVDYLKIQVAEVAKDIEALEGKLYNSRQAGLPVLESKLKQLTETNGGLNDAWVKTRIEKAAAAERLSRVEQALKDSTVNAAEIPIQSETLESLRHDLQQREAELAKAREVYRDKHPKLLVLESELDAIRRSIRAELSKSVATLREDYTSLAGREATLRSNIAQTDGQVRNLNDQRGQHASLESDLAAKRDLHTLLVGKVQEAEISDQVQAPLAKVVEPATAGQEPVRPRRGLNLLLGLMVGLLSGVGLALLMEYLRRCIRTPKDVVEQLHLPVLGMIPRRA